MIYLVIVLLISIVSILIYYNKRCKHDWELVEDRPHYYQNDRYVSLKCKKCYKYKIIIYEAKHK